MPHDRILSSSSQHKIVRLILEDICTLETNNMQFNLTHKGDRAKLKTDQRRELTKATLYMWAWTLDKNVLKKSAVSVSLVFIFLIKVCLRLMYV